MVAAFPTPNQVGGGMADVGAGPAGTHVSYSAAVPDLVGTNGLPVAAFANFPLESVP